MTSGGSVATRASARGQTSRGEGHLHCIVPVGESGSRCPKRSISCIQLPAHLAVSRLKRWTEEGIILTENERSLYILTPILPTAKAWPRQDLRTKSLPVAATLIPGGALRHTTGPPQKAMVIAQTLKQRTCFALEPNSAGTQRVVPINRIEKRDRHFRLGQHVTSQRPD
jgi:hypothetical protein